MAHHSGMELNDLSDEALAGLELKLTRDLEMVRRVRAMLAEYRGGTPLARAASVVAAAPVLPEAPAPVPPGLAPGAPQPVLKDMKTKVLEAAAEMGKPFRMKELLRALGGQPERSSVRSALKRLAMDGEILTLSREAGQNGNLYGLTAATAPPVADTGEPAAAVTNGSSVAPVEEEA